MTNIIEFPGRNRPVLRNLKAADLHEAFVMAAMLIKDWSDVTFEVEVGRCVMDGPDPWPSEFAISFGGEPVLPSRVIELAGLYLPDGPLPGYLLTLFALWNSEAPEDPITTYAAAIEWCSDVVSDTREEQSRPPRAGRAP